MKTHISLKAITEGWDKEQLCFKTKSLLLEYNKEFKDSAFSPQVLVCKEYRRVELIFGCRVVQTNWAE